MSPQTNGICERFHKTILQEFYQVTFRKKLYTTLEDLQKDLDEKHANIDVLALVPTLLRGNAYNFLHHEYTAGKIRHYVSSSSSFSPYWSLREAINPVTD